MVFESFGLKNWAAIIIHETWKDKDIHLLKRIKINNKSMALQLRRAKIDWSGCCQMAVQGALWLAKRYPSTLISVFLTRFHYFSYQAATQLTSRVWVDPVPDPMLLEKFLRYSRQLNPGPLGWQSDVLTTIPNRWSLKRMEAPKWKGRGKWDHTWLFSHSSTVKCFKILQLKKSYRYQNFFFFVIVQEPPFFYTENEMSILKVFVSEKII